MTSESTFYLRPEELPEGELERILRGHLPWITERVRKRLGPALRAKGETQDVVQSALLKVLQYGPRARVTDESAFRALLARLVENVIRDEHAWFTARRRAMSRERPLPGDSSICLDPPRDEIRSPSQEAAERELIEWLNLGLELVDASDREVLRLRQWEGIAFPEIGRRLGISESGARMRYGRALARLASCITSLKQGKIDELLQSIEDDSSMPPESLS